MEKGLVNEKLKKWAREKGALIETTAPTFKTALWSASIRHTQAMLIAKGLALFLWNEAVVHAAYLRNREL